MAKRCFLMTILLFALVFLAAGESHAVIYKYVNEKGVPTFADDLQKIPEQFRATAVIVSGAAVDEKAEEEKARLAAEALEQKEKQARQVSTAPKAAAEETIGRRLIRSGIAVGVFIALLFVLANIHGLQEQARLLSRIRGILVLLLFAFLGFTHATDVAGLFGKAGETVKNPIAQIQEDSAAKGRKAADTYKAIDKILEQRVNDEKAKYEEMEKKLEDAEKGK